MEPARRLGLGVVLDGESGETRCVCAAARMLGVVGTGVVHGEDVVVAVLALAIGGYGESEDEKYQLVSQGDYSAMILTQRATRRCILGENTGTVGVGSTR